MALESVIPSQLKPCLLMPACCCSQQHLASFSVSSNSSSQGSRSQPRVAGAQMRRLAFACDCVGWCAPLGALVEGGRARARACLRACMVGVRSAPGHSPRRMLPAVCKRPIGIIERTLSGGAPGAPPLDSRARHCLEKPHRRFLQSGCESGAAPRPRAPARRGRAGRGPAAGRQGNASWRKREPRPAGGRARGARGAAGAKRKEGAPAAPAGPSQALMGGGRAARRPAVGRAC